MGYGFPIEAPMTLGVPRGLRSPNSPGLPEFEALPDVKMPMLAAKPRMKRADVTDFSSAREEDVRQFAAEMGAAFAQSRIQDKIMRAKAKARGRAAQRIAQKR